MRLHILLTIYISLLSSSLLYSAEEALPTADSGGAKAPLSSITNSGGAKAKASNRLESPSDELASPRKKAKEAQHHELTNCPDFLFHSTGAHYLFELNVNGGAPRGAAFFSAKETGDRYIRLYHRDTTPIARQLCYALTATPKVAELRALAEEKNWVEQQLGIKLPERIRGRGSIIDRFPEYKNAICELYIAKGYDALYDKKNDVIVFFYPEKFMKILSVLPLGPSLTRTTDGKEIKLYSGESLYLYEILIFYWMHIKINDFNLFTENKKTLSTQGKQIQKSLLQLIKAQKINSFRLPIFPITPAFFDLQNKDKMTDLLEEDGDDDCEWIFTICEKIIPLAPGL
jgi:hypothetical protein